jgi:hypothetical protein
VTANRQRKERREQELPIGVFLKSYSPVEFFARDGVLAMVSDGLECGVSLVARDENAWGPLADLAEELDALA